MKLKSLKLEARARRALKIACLVAILALLAVTLPRLRDRSVTDEIVAPIVEAHRRDEVLPSGSVRLAGYQRSIGGGFPGDFYQCFLNDRAVGQFRLVCVAIGEVERTALRDLFEKTTGPFEIIVGDPVKIESAGFRFNRLYAVGTDKGRAVTFYDAPSTKEENR